jgi:fructosamine-3-kinase
LEEIQEHKLEELKEYMGANSNDNLETVLEEEIVVDEMRKRLKEVETTQHLMIWHDLSTVENHSHLGFMVTCLYDPACFYKDSEYEQLTGGK